MTENRGSKRMGFDFEYLMHRSGLGHILLDIFLRLDGETLSRLDEVSQAWEEFFVVNQVLAKKLRRLGSIEKLYQRLSGEFISDYDDHQKRKDFLVSTSREGLTASWLNKDVSVKRLAPYSVVDIKIIGHDMLLHTAGPSVNLTERTPRLVEPGEDGRDPDYRLAGLNEFVGHRLEVCTLDICGDLCVSAGKDRCISYWNFHSGTLASRYVNAHDRQICMVRLYRVAGKKGKFVTVSSARDWAVKIWMVDRVSGSGTVDVVPKQTLQLSHIRKSYWSIDFSWPYLVAGSASQRCVVWKSTPFVNRCSENPKEFLLPVQFDVYADFFDGRQDSLRAVAIINANPNFVFSGDLKGRLNVWNLDEKRLQYTVPDEKINSFFETRNYVSSIVQARGLAFVAYNKHFKVFSTHKVREELVLIRSVSIENEIVSRMVGDQYYLPPPTIKSIEVCDTGCELYACTHLGLFVISVWNG